MASNSIFLGVTTSPAREVAVECLAKTHPQTIHFPCVGRFAVVEAWLQQFHHPERVFTSDIGLFSSILGVLATDPTNLSDLKIRLPEWASVREDDTPLTTAIWAMLAIGKATHVIPLPL